MNEESLFQTFIKYTFKRWAGLQAAINEGMLGLDAEAWMVEVVEKFFIENNDVHTDEIEYYINTILETNFDTYFEDGSVREVSHNFCIAYTLSKTNPNAEIFQEMRHNIETHSVNNSSTNPNTEIFQEIRHNIQAHSSNNSLEENLEPMEEEEVPCQQMESLSVSANDPELDGWTTVTKKNKRHQ